MTWVAPPAEATRPPEAAGEGDVPPPPRAPRAAEPDTGTVLARSTLTYPTPLAALLALVGAVAFAVMPGTGALLIFALFDLGLVILFLADTARLPKRPDLTVERILPSVFSLGHWDELKIVIGGRAAARRKPQIRATVVQTGTEALEVVLEPGKAREASGSTEREPNPVLFRLGGGRDSVIRYSVRPRSRGRHRFTPVFVHLRGNLGLSQRRFTFEPPGEVRVYPDLDDVKRAELALRRSRFLETGLRTRRMIGQGTEFESLREYHPDDDVRQINWHATARMGRPITNQYRVDRNQTVVTLIDCGRLMSTPIGEWSRLDIALANAAGVSHACARLEDRIGAVAFDDKIRASLQPRRARVDHVLAALFDLEPSLSESDYDRAFAEVAKMKRALVMVFTDILDAGSIRPLVTALPALVQKHQVLVASVRDPEIDAATDEEPVDPEAAFRQAAAVEVLERRGRAIGKIIAIGADVVEAPPDQITPELINAYLRAKLRMRL